jgi:hypothetical protein
MSMKRNLATVLIALAITGGTTTMVFAKTSGGSPDGRNASKSQYGCPSGTYGDHCLPPSGCSHGSGTSGSHNSHSSSYSNYSSYSTSKYGSTNYGNTSSHSSEPSCTTTSGGHYSH